MAFFLTFFIWFNFAPLATSVQKSLELSDQQLRVLFLCNIALTVPARILIGMLVDRYGPSKTYSRLLVGFSLLCLVSSLATSFGQLVVFRVLLSGIGAGFVIGIRMIGEWFGPKEVGLAEGIYGGWGNFGSAAAAFTLPGLALLAGGEEGWRVAMALSGFLGLAYVWPYFRYVRDTPSGKTYFSPKRVAALEVCSRGDLAGLIATTLPLVGCMALIVWKLAGIGFISPALSWILYALLAALFTFQVRQILNVNRPRLKAEILQEDSYHFRNVAVLNLAYAVSFGSEIAVVSMLPAYFERTFDLTPALAGTLAASFAFMNLVARPFGGVFSDRVGRRFTLIVLFLCLGVAYLGMSRLGPHWPLPLAVALTMTCSFFVQSAEGAVFAVVPLIKRRLTGQIAGMVGAYGNVGAIAYLTVYSLTDAATFFAVIGISSAAVLLACRFLEEPRGTIVEYQPDGKAELLEVA